MKIQGVDFKYVLGGPNSMESIWYRLRIYLAVRLTPAELSDHGKLWMMGFQSQVGYILKPCCPEMAKHMHKEEVHVCRIKSEKKSRKSKKRAI